MYIHSIMSIIIVAEFKAEVDRVLYSVGLTSHKHAHAMGAWEHALEKFWKFALLTLNLETVMMKNYEVVKLIMGGASH